MNKTYHLSKILDDLNINEEIKIFGNDEFNGLALIDHIVNFKTCTYIEKKDYIKNIKSNICIIITSPDIVELLNNKDVSICVTDRPSELYFRIHNYLSENLNRRSHFKSSIDPTAKISPLASISKTNVKIGKNVFIEEFVSIKSNTTIGDNCIIRSGTVIGGEGFQFHNISGRKELIKHVGGVIIGEHVEIQQNSCIDRAIYSWDNTCIGDQTKVDNLVHIAHGAKIGKKCMIVALSCVAGRVEIGDGTWVGINSSIRNGLKIGKNARINMGSVVTKNLDDYECVSGNFAVDHNIFIENIKKMNK